MEINKELLIAFIAKAHRHTYAAPKEVREEHKCKTSILIGHKDYKFQEDDFLYHDSYAGITWAPGREVVFYKGAPIWSMSYQGQHNEDYDGNFFQKKAFPFLKIALMNFDDKIPFRGPKEFIQGEFKYTFKLDGDYTYFKGREEILYNGEEVFHQDVMGTLIK